ncbi:T9SS type A sorting domain-containing protein [Chryseobacterium oranimense]|uniref:Por secretion system C-terminal sorting domain-containing protein n=1 Tax=Chryseobacterium oranimense TaxID=421058 RepID=A0A1M5PSU7_9FLAO|nr:T9SS type A sorting domain-containing protein [Chryseobacterium oranimense]UWX59748.1 T9SS type A sorting domain-containing protein [Chryseobacterium oranimense]SHH04646.1 Por secretion system C-terminal sorting domain-containing protein [Chryseobacterium oranimense]
MKRTSIHCFFLILFTFSVSLLNAQSAVLATGTNASGGNGSVSYSVGQTAYLYKGANSEILEGVQQGYEIIALSTSETLSKQEGILLYPNPTRDYLYIDFTSLPYKGSEYQLYDAQGKLVKKDVISQSKSELNLSSLPSAVYIIRINQKGENLKTFKVIKK